MREKRFYAIIPITLVILLVLPGINNVSFNRNKVEKKTKYSLASWSYGYGDIEEISQDSDIIAIVRVSNQAHSYEKDGLPYTETSVEVINSIYGAELGDILNVLQIGGKTDDSTTVLEADPILENNEEFLIFAQRNENGSIKILGGPQGRLRYSNGVLNSLQAEDSADMNIKVVNESVDDITQQIQKALRNLE